MREETVPGDPVRARARLLPAREVQPGDLGLRGRSTSTPSPRRSTSRSRSWLEHQAPDYYAESDADVGYATPDAVTLATVHQAKGMQWPAVFMPVPAQEPLPVEAAWAASASSTSSRTPRSPTPTATAARSRTRRACSTSRSRARRSTCSCRSRPAPNQLYRKRSDFFDHCREPAVVLDQGHRRAGRRAAARAPGPRTRRRKSRSRSRS